MSPTALLTTIRADSLPRWVDHCVGDVGHPMRVASVRRRSRRSDPIGLRGITSPRLGRWTSAPLTCHSSESPASRVGCEHCTNGGLPFVIRGHRPARQEGGTEGVTAQSTRRRISAYRVRHGRRSLAR